MERATGMRPTHHGRQRLLIISLVISLVLFLIPFYMAAKILTSDTTYGFASPGFHCAHTEIHGIDYSYWDGNKWVFERDGKICRVWSEKWKR
jgi:hypothetical protein